MQSNIKPKKIEIRERKLISKNSIALDITFNYNIIEKEIEQNISDANGENTEIYKQKVFEYETFNFTREYFPIQISNLEDLLTLEYEETIKKINELKEIEIPKEIDF